MERIKAWLLAAALALGAPGSAQAAVAETPHLRILGLEHGLPASNVNGLAFDRSGYLWIATTDGLARFDGVGMRVWRHDPNDPASLPGNFVETVHVDERDRVWAAVEGRGLSMLDSGREGFRHYRKSTHAEVGSDDVWALASRGGETWFGTFGGGLHRLAADGRIHRYTHAPGDANSLPSDIVLTLATGPRGLLWVGTSEGLARWNGRGFERLALPGAKAAAVYSLAVEGRSLWVGTAAGLHRLDDGDRWHTPAWSPMFEKPNAVLAITPEGDGRYWLASQRGLWRVPAAGAPQPVRLATKGPPRSVLQILRQPDGALWLPVSGAGLGYLRPDWRRLSQPTPASDTGADVFYRHVARAGDGGVWLTQGKGAVDWLGPAGVFESMPPEVLERLEGRRLMSVVEDRRGQLWLGDRGTLLRIGRDAGVREWSAGDGPDAPLGGQIDLLRIAPDGTLWMSCSGAGLQQRDVESGRVLATIAAGAAQGLGVGDLETIDFDARGRLWAAGGDGVSWLDAAAGVLRPVPGTARGDRVFAFGFDGADVLWLQRLAGLERYRRQGEKWVREGRVGTAEGMPAVEASGLAVDRRGRVWVATQRGLLRWDPKLRRLRAFGVEDGLSSQEFNDRALVLAPDGVLTATLADGRVMQLDTSAEDPPTSAHALRVDRIETRRDGRWQPLDPAAPALAPHDRELRVQLRLLAFANFRANRYWTRLDGLDPDWVEHTGSDPGERVFAGLAPGRYTLHMRAADAGGQMSTAQPVPLTVQAPWWRTPWAAAGFAAAALMLAWAAWRVQRARLRRRRAWEQAERERELAHQASLAKSRFLATLGHEVRTPMTGVLGMSELLLDTPLTPQQRDYTHAIRGAGEHLLRLVNDALDLSRIEAGKLQLVDEAFDLHALMRDIAQLIGPLAHRRGLAFALDIVPSTPCHVRGDAGRVRQILLNLLGNAVKFTERGEVGLRVEPAGDGIRVSVHDTGPGLSEEHKTRLFQRFEQGEGARTAARFGGSGLGLAICQELAAAMGGQIAVQSAAGQGTRFEVDLPLAVMDDTPAALPVIEPARSEVLSRAPLRLLLVEDDATVAEVIAGLLRAQGHHVIHAGHGLAALAAIATTTFDVALLDLDLPGMDGFALARHLRSLGFELPLVAVTARADGAAEHEARSAGFDRFLRKPVTGEQLACVLRECTDAAEA